MQELLGRISRLDPTASLGLRVIACFDELVVGNVNTRALLSAAASLAACVAGFEQDHPHRTLRVTPAGEHATGEPGPRTGAEASDGLTVWLERDGEPGANDAIILERLALAVRIRHGRGRTGDDNRRDLGLLLDQTVPAEDRRLAAAALGLAPGGRYRVVTAPLFAVWTGRPSGPEDVVPTRHGPIHALVVPAEAPVDEIRASPCGVGSTTQPDLLHHSFRTSLVALRLCRPPATPRVTAEDYPGLVDVFADAPPDARYPDLDLVEQVTAQAWGQDTLEAVITSGSARQAARALSIHHSTMQARLDTITAALGFDPYDGMGKVRVGIAFLAWRLARSTVLDLPAPTYRAAGS